uniref:DUF1725 domain-containing protein n=1 Tax=Sus scrofa TaxID=9823 RepID=A0A8D0Z3R0_PIG
GSTSHVSEWPSLIRQQITNAGEGVEKREPSCTAGGNVKLVQPLWKTLWKYLRKLNIELPYDPAIPLLGICLDKTFTEKDTCTPTFNAALFTRAKRWKQPKCPSTDEWTKKMWYTYTMEYYSAIKKTKIMPFAATWMQLEVLEVVKKRKTNTI